MQYNQDMLRRLQLTELEILKDIDRVCRAHGIAYWLDSGTALGAMRHGGFIPWDDDIDVGMPRGDYERFLKVAPETLGERYCLTTPYTNPHQAALFAKVMLKGTRFATAETLEAGFEQGIFVDVFPYDFVCPNPRDAKRQRRCCVMWQSISYLYHSKHIVVPHGGVLGVLERIACRMAHIAARALFSPARIAHNFDLAATMANNDKAANEMMAASYASVGSYARCVLIPSVEMNFEGCSFFVPADVEKYLCTQYGETWNQLPSEEQRRNHAPKVLKFDSSANFTS